MGKISKLTKIWINTGKLVIGIWGRPHMGKWITGNLQPEKMGKMGSGEGRKLIKNDIYENWLEAPGGHVAPPPP